MQLTIATWNINSVRLRLPIVEHLLDTYSPDILCLQETKCPDELFPHAAFEARGYRHIAINGQKGYHGVATISRRPIETVERRLFCGIPDSRHLSTRFAAGAMSILIHNFYVPAGGDAPDPDINPKFRHKLDFVAEMRAVRAEWGAVTASILVGDLNIAPLEHDVWSHKQLLNVVSHTPVETEGFEAMRLERRMGRPDAHGSAGRPEALHVVELPGTRLGFVGPRPAARPHLVVGKSRRAAHRDRGDSRCARLGAPLGPRAGDRAFRHGLEQPELRRLTTRSVAPASRSG